MLYIPKSPMLAKSLLNKHSIHLCMKILQEHHPLFVVFTSMASFANLCHLTVDLVWYIPFCDCINAGYFVEDSQTRPDQTRPDCSHYMIADYNQYDLNCVSFSMK